MNKEINERLDRICAGIKSAECLNVLHACRPDHPWNKTAKTPWQNAYFVVNSRPYAERPSARDLDWLRAQADLEAARERVSKIAERDGEVLFAREVRAGAWDHRPDVQAALRGEKLRGEA
jgi:hypothetical protein